MCTPNTSSAPDASWENVNSSDCMFLGAGRLCPGKKILAKVTTLLLTMLSVCTGLCKHLIILGILVK